MRRAPRVEFGLVVPADGLQKGGWPQYMEDVHHLLTRVTGAFSSAWLIDHLQFEGEDVLEGWTTLTYLAALHPALQWGHMVLCQSFRNPALVAKMAATLQFLSGGRYILGMGAGWHGPEYRAYGYTFPAARTRVEELDEALQVIKALWTQERATVAGRHHHVEDALCEPRPDPVPPVMVGGAKPKMLRVVARHADWWSVSSMGIEAYRARVREFERACAEVGRDPGSVRRTWSGGCVCARTAAEVGELAGKRYQSGEDFVGTPQQLIEQMQPFVELGVHCFMLDCGGFPRLTTAEMLVTEVLPALNG
jgi:alkanesulfonate monooxygenase SsuD/methylene tetrahydromethanopterin reductase-like flavin-dependent oxidoreductase (luciferase family)